MVIGIDPGISTTGIALVQNAKLFKHKTLLGKESFSYIENLHTLYRFKHAVIEKPKTGVLYQRHFTKSNKIMSDAGMIKLAQNIGQNIQLTNELVDKLESLGIEVLQVNPKRKCTKWKKEYWQMVFGWEGKLPSEHARDASIHALQWEKWVGWNLSKKVL